MLVANFCILRCYLLMSANNAKLEIIQKFEPESVCLNNKWNDY